MIYLIGDIVMLKDPNNYTCTYANKLNLFKVKTVTANGYILNGIIEEVTREDVLPVPIDKKHDCKIYLYYVPINVQRSSSGELLPFIKNTQYYMETIKGDSELYEQLNKLSYVHEAQRVIASSSNPHNKLEIDNY